MHWGQSFKELSAQNVWYDRIYYNIIVCHSTLFKIIFNFQIQFNERLINLNVSKISLTENLFKFQTVFLKIPLIFTRILYCFLVFINIFQLDLMIKGHLFACGHLSENLKLVRTPVVIYLRFSSYFLPYVNVYGQHIFCPNCTK